MTSHDARDMPPLEQERYVVTPLENDDPPKVGDFWLDARLAHLPSGVAYAGHADDQTPVVLILLSRGAAADGAARQRFSGLVNELHIDTVLARGGQGQDDGRLGKKFRSEEDDPVEPDDAPLAPWVALVSDGSPGAGNDAVRILQDVGLATLPHKGTPSGPDYRLPWEDQTAPGFSRLWPLPWPGRYDRAGWMSMLLSWLLMLLIAAMAILLAILLFQKAPETPPPPPVPTTMTSPPPRSSSASPQSGSPSPTTASGSPSPASGSPSPQGSPTPNSKL